MSFVSSSGIAASLMLVAFSTSYASSEKELEDPQPVVQVEKKNHESKASVDIHSRPIPAPIVRPIPANQLLTYRTEILDSRYEYTKEKGLIQR